MIKLKELLEKKTNSGVLLDEKSRNLLLKTYEDMIPQGWERICHHMTIAFGKLADKENIPVTLKVEAVGKSDKALAVKVSGYHSANKIPHITIAIDRDGGARPKDSNDIKSWTDVKDGVILHGTVKNL